ncbi:MAG: hypothetical protein V4471_00535 [Pseudomonadota bacterium]
METAENIANARPSLNNNTDSDSDSSYTLSAPLNRRGLLDIRKEYINRAEGRLLHIAAAKEGISQVEQSHIEFSKLLKVKENKLTIDLEKISRFQTVYNERDATCERIIGKTKQISEQFAKDVLTAIERGGQKKLSKNIAELHKIFQEEEKFLGKKYKREINKFIKFEEALNSYSIIPVEPEHNVIYQIGVLHHAQVKKLITPREFRIAVSVRINQLPDAFRWSEKEEKIFDMTSDFDGLAYQLHDYLEDESEAYLVACQRFKKRVKGISHETEINEEATTSALEQLDVRKTDENQLSIAGSSAESEALTEKKNTLFYRLFPEEIRTLSEIVNINGSLYLGQSMESLTSDYQKSVKQGKKKELTPSEHLKYALRAQDVVNETVSHTRDNVMNGLPLAYTVEGMFPKLQRIEKDYQRKTNEALPPGFNGTATEHFFSDYSLYLDTKLEVLHKDLKKHDKKRISEKIKLSESEIEKYKFIKTRAESLKKLVLSNEQEKKIIVGADVSVYEYGASFKVISEFEKQLEGRNKEELLQLRFKMEEEQFGKKEYNRINQLHKAERCLSGDKWKPLPEVFTVYLDKKINFLQEETAPQGTLGEQLVAAIEEDTHRMRKISNPGSFFQSLREEKEEPPTAKQMIQEGAIGIFTSIF